ncbi:MAG: chromate transporter [Betaproteobacteria bacterium]|nr:chromate transporter [Betaproteobacteria bacterium]
MLELALYFSMLSLISFGGISSVLPEMQRIVVDVKGWVAPAEFTQLFAVSQAAPGPNILFMSLIGWKMAGFGGALVALASFCLPAALIAYWVGALWEKFRDAPWVKMTKRALLPMTVALALSGGYVLATPVGLDWRYVVIAAASSVAVATTRLNPLWFLAAGGVLGAVLLG